MFARLSSWYSRMDSNQHWTGSRPAASTNWATRVKTTFSGTPPWVRTRTGRRLRPLPLPIGLEGRKHIPSAHQGMRTAALCISRHARRITTEHAEFRDLLPIPLASQLSNSVSETHVTETEKARIFRSGPFQEGCSERCQIGIGSGPDGHARRAPPKHTALPTIHMSKYVHECFTRSILSIRPCRPIRSA